MGARDISTGDSFYLLLDVFSNIKFVLYSDANDMIKLIKAREFRMSKTKSPAFHRKKHYIAEN